MYPRYGMPFLIQRITREESKPCTSMDMRLGNITIEPSSATPRKPLRAIALRRWFSLAVTHSRFSGLLSERNMLRWSTCIFSSSGGPLNAIQTMRWTGTDFTFPHFLKLTKQYPFDSVCLRIFPFMTLLTCPVLLTLYEFSYPTTGFHLTFKIRLRFLRTCIAAIIGGQDGNFLEKFTVCRPSTCGFIKCRITLYYISLVLSLQEASLPPIIHLHLRVEAPSTGRWDNGGTIRGHKKSPHPASGMGVLAALRTVTGHCPSDAAPPVVTVSVGPSPPLYFFGQSSQAD